MKLLLKILILKILLLSACLNAQEYYKAIKYKIDIQATIDNIVDTDKLYIKKESKDRIKPNIIEVYVLVPTDSRRDNNQLAKQDLIYFLEEIKDNSGKVIDTKIVGTKVHSNTRKINAKVLQSFYNTKNIKEHIAKYSLIDNESILDVVHNKFHEVGKGYINILLENIDSSKVDLGSKKTYYIPVNFGNSENAFISVNNFKYIYIDPDDLLDTLSNVVYERGDTGVKMLLEGLDSLVFNGTLDRTIYIPVNLANAREDNLAINGFYPAINDSTVFIDTVYNVFYDEGETGYSVLLEGIDSLTVDGRRDTTVFIPVNLNNAVEADISKNEGLSSGELLLTFLGILTLAFAL